MVEAITSILPICDYFLVAVGRSDDETLDLIRSIGDPKIHILETEWDDSLRAGGQVLAVETNKAFDAIPAEFDWCFYIQADECVHENDLPTIQSAMKKYLNDPKTEGLLFNYLHFYGSFDFVGTSRRWYRREVRIIRNDKKIRSFRDAQGFRKLGKKLKVRLLDANIHHYGWVRHPAAQQQKQLNFNKLWHSDEAAKLRVGDSEIYKYNDLEPIEKFKGLHPKAMLPRIAAVNWQFENDPTFVKLTLKEKISFWMEKYTGWRVGEYKNYKLIGGRNLFRPKKSK